MRRGLCARLPTNVHGRSKINLDYLQIMAEYITEYCHFFTATNLEWKNLLMWDKYKDIVIESMRHLVKNKKVIIFFFVGHEESLNKLGLCVNKSPVRGLE